MESKTGHVVQVFVRKRGQLVPGDREVALTENGAKKKAAALASRNPGAAALTITVDDDTGELQAAKILETHGEVPEDFAESLLGG